MPRLSPTERKHAAGLMRVNHAGEICAQALYRGQATTAKLEHIRAQMTEAALEEIDHLAWCESRLKALNAHTSLMGPIWYGGSWMIGALAGLIGDKYSLGFVAETEKQVSLHIQKHLEKLPQQDAHSQAILNQMNEDELQHAEMAIAAGAAELPKLIRLMMCAISKIMTKSSYHI